MVRNFTADYIIPVKGEPLKGGTVAVNEHGEIVGLYEKDNGALINQHIEKYEGIITPGFVNTHCHLELSHLSTQMPKHEGLVSFVKRVISQRKASDNVVLNAIEKADKTMKENGIVAVGDVSNTSHSKEVKLKSSIYYHTFVEVVGFDPAKSKDDFEGGLELKEDFDSLPNSVVPHASYSVCKDLFKEFRLFCKDGDNLFSIHNQESEEENKFYRYKSGEFIDFYKSLDLDIDFFKPQGRNSLQSIVPLLPKDQKILLVHNLYTSPKDIYFLNRLGRDITWCFCPNANLFIENKLPNLHMFMSHKFNITLGTDSLASNDKLCILSELKTVSQHFPSLPLTTTLAWATLNGAKFLGIDKTFGSLEKGKKPGLNLITATDGLKITPQSQVKKLV